MDKSILRRWALMTLGVASLTLAIIGIFVPLLPTTPLLLLAAACFFRSSDRLYRWLVNHRWFGSYIRHYREHRAITRQAKVAALVMLWSVLGYTTLFVTEQWWMRALLGAVAVGVTLHLLQLKTLTREMMDRYPSASEVEEAG